RRQNAGAGLGQKLAWIWLLVPFVFFSLAQSKREPYLLPVAPAVAWLVAWLLDRLLAGGLERWQVRACVAVSATLGAVLLLGGVGVLWPGMVDAPGHEMARDLTAGSLLVAAVIILGAASRRQTRRYAPAGVWIAFVLLYVFLATFVHREANAFKSHQSIARELEQRLPEGSRLYSFFGRYRVVRGGYPYYLGRTVRDLVDEDRLRQTWAQETRPCVIYEEARYQGLVEGLPAAQVLFEGRVGSKTVRLVCAQAEVAGTQQRAGT
ncbi:MAG: hypothetical protein O7A98_10015, partial [Acidobacteria bacterium]|nr:hypothetical protein [Acidobacteriota bacterium]